MLRTRAGGARGTATAGLVALVLVLAACGDDNSASSRLDRVDTTDGIKVTITGCDAKKLKETSDGISQTAYTAKGTIENTSGDPRTGVRVHVTFLDGDDEFYDTTVSDTFTFGGFDGDTKEFSESVTLSDEVNDLNCTGTATS